FSNTSNAIIDLDNSSGVSLVTNLTLTGPLSFTNGTLNTGARTLTLAVTSSVSGAAHGSGWVNRTIRKNYAACALSKTPDVGDDAEHAGSGVSGGGGGAVFTRSASSPRGEPPILPSPAIDTARCVHRRWTLAPASAAGATWSATFSFPSLEVDAAATPAAFIGQAWNGGAWSSLTMGVRGPTSTQVTGLSVATAGTVFAFGNPVSRSLAVNVAGGA